MYYTHNQHFLHIENTNPSLKIVEFDEFDY